VTSTDEREFDQLLEYLRHTRGFDFSAYKRAGLQRRMRRRLRAAGVETFASYVDHLDGHPGEFALLFNTALINVTSFFRDPAAWQKLRDTVVPQLLAQRAGTDPIRAWCAGCASGEEAFSIAIVLCEAIGPDAFRERVKIYATDIDEPALDEARHATYLERALENVPEALRDRYFARSGEGWKLHKRVRESVIFARHDLMQDAPIARIDLLSCRNTLMYFNAEAQGRIVSRFHFALRDAGVLFLGRAETLLTCTTGFGAVDLKLRLFAKQSLGAS
jgi:two-component system, chemotaxis family, CheB/CheR fusion protein